MGLYIEDISKTALNRDRISMLQINLGMLCNQSCKHCHHNAGPKRTELMSAEVCRKTLEFATKNDIMTIELTGGAPELNPNFKDLVIRARELERKVISRTNLTVLFEDGMEGLAQFLASNNVELVCSLPCYLEENVDAQRGASVYEKSIKALKMLNSLGYGKENSSLVLNLVYNPGDAFLPCDQGMLENAYRQNLYEMHGIVFNKLYAITNMPIGRFARQLQQEGKYNQYMSLLRNKANFDLLNNAMCRTLISVGWDGCVYDCDFNQALGYAIDKEKKLWDFSLNELLETRIVIDEHCYGCIAGFGSSCTGRLDQ